MMLAGALEDGADVGVLHFLAGFVVNDGSAIAVEDGAEEVECAGDVEVGDFLWAIEVATLLGHGEPPLGLS